MQFPQYESYKDSGVEWLGEIPSHWDAKELKYIVDINLSNVDKNVYSYEQDIFLCNYLDVYNNDYISSRISFSKGSAKKEEIEKFSLKDGDILITKDSEDYNDIAIPALVTETFDNVLCGYHLAILRNNKNHIHSPYLFFFLKSTIASSYFSCRANGITRYGISSGTIKNISTILPTIEEQKRIANFLDQKTAEIDEAIAKKQKLIELLQEQKAILINRAVTKGLNPNVTMRDSGIEWIGQIPEHWEIRKNRYIFTEINKRSEKGKELHLCMSQKLGLVPSDEVKNKPLQSESYEGAKLCSVNDIVLNRLKAHLGVFSVSFYDGLVSPDYTVFRLQDPRMKSKYFEYLYKTNTYISEFNKRVKGIVVGFYRLYSGDFYDIPCILPPVEEQCAIERWIQNLNAQVSKLEESIQKEINKLEELKQILISNAVTGKIKI